LKCKLCNRETKNKSEYCELHGKAYANIVEKFETWKKASGTSWEEYLNELVKNPFTGVWAKEVAEQLLKKEE